MNRGTSTDQGVQRDIGERGKNPYLDCGCRLHADRDHQETNQDRLEPLHYCTDFEFDAI